MKFRLQATTIALAGALTLLAQACNATAKPPRGSDNAGLAAGRLAEVNPTDIAVLPIRNRTGKQLPLEQMRASFQAGLVRLRYSPLALDYVDQHRAVEAAYTPGQLGEQAALQVTITGWDDSRWDTHSRLIVDADVYLLDATVGEALWGGHVTRRVDMAAEVPAAAQEVTLFSRAVDVFVGDVLASIPPRDPRR